MEEIVNHSHMNHSHMNYSQRPRSSSVTITIENPQLQERHPIAYELVHTAMNGNADPNVINLIGKRLKKNKGCIIYPELADKRDLLKLAPQSYDKHNREYILTYVINELTDSSIKERLEKKKERRQKYIIAAAGATTTIISTIVAAITTHYIEK